MKNLKYYISLLWVVVLASCNDGVHDLLKSGKLFLNTSYIGEVEVTQVNTRAGENADEPVYSYNEESLKNSTIIWISSDEGVVRKYNGLSTMPSRGLQLAGGVYLAEAWAGDSVSASWSAKFYKANQRFVIDGDANVDLRLSLANVFASVVIDKSVDAVLTDYQVTISHSRGSRTFVGKDTRVASFMMPTNHNAKEDESPKEDKLRWKMTGTEMSGESFVKEGTINYVSEGHQYVLTFSHNGGVAAIGGALIALDLKDLDLITDNCIVAQPPTIQGEEGAPLSEPILISKGKQTENINVEIGAVGHFSVVELSGDDISKILGDGGEKINLWNAGNDPLTLLEGRGIKMTPFNDNQDYYDVARNLSSMKIVFTPDFVNSLEIGTHEIGIYVKDNGGGDNSDDREKPRESRATLTLAVSSEVVSIRIPNLTEFKKPENGNVTPSTLRLPGTLMDATAQFSGLALDYRVAGTEPWTRVQPSAVSRAASNYEFYIEGLTPNTDIEYRTVWTVDGEETGSAIQTIKTADNKVQNGGFEEWSMDGKIQLLAKDKNSKYWDSGNEGASKASKTVTQPASDIKHSGNYSAKLVSQMATVMGVGKFAAGNAFVGKYLTTDVMDGVLGWGRPFYFRPKALKGYVKYNPGTVNHTASGAPDIVSGQLDKGIIYVALLNDDMEAQGDASYPDFPVVVRTKTTKLFDKTASNVIAYGEMVFHNSTEGDDMIEFTIPIEYYESMKDQKVCYLLLVCSASKGGDYFAGGEGSTMYIDDFEFVY
ncbi:MAG: PCMD domain-containing protein [Muribaculaceae bacterium]|nr:PCMD domain-containing protein [Muribaculaceae bacterium]